MDQSIPLRNIPIAITVDEVEVRGEISTLYPNDITVVIISPVSGLRTGVHIPHFAMGACAVGTSTGLTPYGRRRARELLARLYACSRGEHASGQVETLTEGEWQQPDDAE